jgi:PIN domain nuclease of toxin-antitoxin system
VKVLLDTHTLLWALDTPQRLGDLARRLIEDPDNEILISPVTPWELAIKVNSGKMPSHVLVTDFHGVIQRQNFTAIPLEPLQAIRSGLLPWHHRDPFDRLLAAQALDLDVPIVSIDKAFDRYGVKRIW